MNRVSLNFSPNKYPDSELKVKASTIHGSLKGNAFFPTLAPELEELDIRITTFDDLLSKMQEGNKQLTAEKNVARMELVETLCSIGRLVQNISKGNEVMILSSGFELTRKPVPTPVNVLDQPENLNVRPGKISGTLDITWDAVEHARSYEIRYMKLPKTDGNPFGILTSARRTATIENLQPGQQYAIQVAGVGIDPRRAWSFEITSFVI